MKSSVPPPPPDPQLAHSLICIDSLTGKAVDFDAVEDGEHIPVNGQRWFWWIIKNVTIHKKMIPDEQNPGQWIPVFDYQELWITDILSHTMSKMRIGGKHTEQ